jgi:hypothetical protein
VIVNVYVKVYYEFFKFTCWLEFWSKRIEAITGIFDANVILSAVKVSFLTFNGVFERLKIRIEGL